MNLGWKAVNIVKNTPLKRMRLFSCKANLENAVYMYHYLASSISYSLGFYFAFFSFVVSFKIHSCKE